MIYFHGLINAKYILVSKHVHLGIDKIFLLSAETGRLQKILKIEEAGEVFFIHAILNEDTLILYYSVYKNDYTHFLVFYDLIKGTVCFKTKTSYIDEIRVIGDYLLCGNGANWRYDLNAVLTIRDLCTGALLKEITLQEAGGTVNCIVPLNTQQVIVWNSGSYGGDDGSSPLAADVCFAVEKSFAVSVVDFVRGEIVRHFETPRVFSHMDGDLGDQEPLPSDSTYDHYAVNRALLIDDNVLITYAEPFLQVLDTERFEKQSVWSSLKLTGVIALWNHPTIKHCIISAESTGRLIAWNTETAQPLVIQQWEESLKRDLPSLRVIDEVQIDFTSGRLIFCGSNCVLFAEAKFGGEALPPWKGKWYSSWEDGDKNTITVTARPCHIRPILTVLGTFRAAADSAIASPFSIVATSAAPSVGAAQSLLSRYSTPVPQSSPLVAAESNSPYPASSVAPVFARYPSTTTPSLPVITPPAILIPPPIIDRKNPFLKIHFYLVEKHQNQPTRSQVKQTDFVALLQSLRASATRIALDNYLRAAKTFYRTNLFAACTGKEKNNYQSLREALKQYTDVQLAQHLTSYFAYLQNQAQITPPSLNTPLVDSLRVQLSQTFGLTQMTPSYFQYAHAASSSFSGGPPTW